MSCCAARTVLPLLLLVCSEYSSRDGACLRISCLVLYITEVAERERACVFFGCWKSKVKYEILRVLAGSFVVLQDL